MRNTKKDNEKPKPKEHEEGKDSSASQKKKTKKAKKGSEEKKQNKTQGNQEKKEKKEKKGKKGDKGKKRAAVEGHACFGMCARTCSVATWFMAPCPPARPCSPLTAGPRAEKSGKAA